MGALFSLTLRDCFHKQPCHQVHIYRPHFSLEYQPFFLYQSPLFLKTNCDLISASHNCSRPWNLYHLLKLVSLFKPFPPIRPHLPLLPNHPPTRQRSSTAKCLSDSQTFATTQLSQAATGKTPSAPPLSNKGSLHQPPQFRLSSLWSNNPRKTQRTLMVSWHVFAIEIPMLT
jgi:hypothetical protein